jgi:predicted Ser/Thr protein kinase
MRCEACASEVPPGARFCPGCAAPTVVPDPRSADPLRSALQAAVGGQYEVRQLLGRGGMGAVYLARERALDRDVAIKVLAPERTSEVERERFRREARTAARLSHPNIVPLHAYGEGAGTMYFVMGCVLGEPLSVRMKHGLTNEAACRILMELADALDYAHRQGVVHRDIKPDNVLVDDDSGRPMLTDFGISKVRGPAKDLTSTGAVIGTPGYMSPEQAAGKEHIDGRSDVYSLGVIGYAMLANRLPFDGPSASEILVQHMTKDPPPLKTVAPDVPDALAVVIMRCLAKDKEDRWPDGRSLREALAAAAEAEELPEPLQAVDGVGLIILAVGLVLGVIEYLEWLDGGPTGPLGGASVPLALAYPAVAALAFLYKAMPARRAGFGWKSITRAAFLEPRWWRWWYPRRLRRPEDRNVWDRLPARIKLDRVLYLAAPVAAVVGILFSRAVLSPRLHGLTDYPLLRAAFFWPPVVEGVRPMPAIGLFLGPLLWALIGLVAFCRYLLAHRWLRRLGLPEHDRKGVISAPLSRRTLWRKPQVAALLRADGEASVPARGDPDASDESPTLAR